MNVAICFAQGTNLVESVKAYAMNMLKKRRGEYYIITQAAETKDATCFWNSASVGSSHKSDILVAMFYGLCHRNKIPYLIYAETTNKHTYLST